MKLGNHLIYQKGAKSSKTVFVLKDKRGIILLPLLTKHLERFFKFQNTNYTYKHWRNNT